MAERKRASAKRSGARKTATRSVRARAGTDRSVELIRAADVTPEELTYMWLDRIPEGAITLIGGRPGQGKSLFTCFLAAFVTQKGGAVIMSNPEDALATVKVPRLIAAGADARLVHFWPGKLRLPTDIDLLEQFVQFHGVKLVTIDPIAKHVVGRDPNLALEPLAAMCERTGCSVIGVHHLNKRLAKDAHPQEAFGGASGGWLGTVRFAHVLGPAAAGEPESRFLAVAKANYADDDVPAVEFYLDEAEIDLPNMVVVEAPRLVYVGDGAKVHASAIVQYRAVGFKKEGSPEKRSVAFEFLTLLLANPKNFGLKQKPGEAVPAQDVFDAAAAHDVSKMTCKRASVDMGIVKERVGFGPGSYIAWSLPKDHPLASMGKKADAEPTDEEVTDAIEKWLADVNGESEDDDE